MCARCAAPGWLPDGHQPCSGQGYVTALGLPIHQLSSCCLMEAGFSLAVTLQTCLQSYHVLGGVPRHVKPLGWFQALGKVEHHQISAGSCLGKSKS